jgi:hypothetical protein
MLLIGIGIGIGRGRGGGVVYERQSFNLRIVFGNRNRNNFVVVIVVVVVVFGEEVEKVRRRQNVCWKGGVGFSDGFCCCYCCCCCGKEISRGREEDWVAAGGVVRKVWVSGILFIVKG